MRNRETLFDRIQVWLEKMLIRERSIVDSGLSDVAKKQELGKVNSHLQLVKELAGIEYIDEWRRCEESLKQLLKQDPSLSIVIIYVHLRPGANIGKIEFIPRGYGKQ